MVKQTKIFLILSKLEVFLEFWQSAKLFPQHLFKQKSVFNIAIASHV